jgi:hypothetical protein
MMYKGVAVAHISAAVSFISWPLQPQKTLVSIRQAVGWPGHKVKEKRKMPVSFNTQRLT